MTDGRKLADARAAIERALAPGYSTCLRCRRPWKFVREHITPLRGGAGCFPLCEGCWSALGSAEARAPFYLQFAGEHPRRRSEVLIALGREDTRPPARPGGNVG